MIAKKKKAAIGSSQHPSFPSGGPHEAAFLTCAAKNVPICDSNV
jgi:hypothetical protein